MLQASRVHWCLWKYYSILDVTWPTTALSMFCGAARRPGVGERLKDAWCNLPAAEVYWCCCNGTHSWHFLTYYTLSYVTKPLAGAFHFSGHVWVTCLSFIPAAGHNAIFAWQMKQFYQKNNSFLYLTHPFDVSTGGNTRAVHDAARIKKLYFRNPTVEGWVDQGQVDH